MREIVHLQTGQVRIAVHRHELLTEILNLPNSVATKSVSISVQLSDEFLP